ncbi:MAG: hypothetical protein NE330_23775 [Lentisphaeraceae bacterium]|nr:hypothetical protein [Lentisphaeraceae bacterium]
MSKILKEKFQAMDIARPLPVFESSDKINFAKLVNHEYVGFIEDGKARSYYKLADESKTIFAFAPEDCVDFEIPMKDILLMLAEKKVVFLKTLGQVNAYVTLEDIQKAPVRMWLFGMLTIIEMFMSRVILAHFETDEEWAKYVPKGRLEKAKELLEERVRRGQNPPLLECLQYGDKAEIFIKDDTLREQYVTQSKTAVRKLIKDFQELRNSLAHSQPILNWESVIVFAQRVDIVLTRI